MTNISKDPKAIALLLEKASSVGSSEQSMYHAELTARLHGVHMGIRQLADQFIAAGEPVPTTESLLAELGK